jgi:hypothetical protein
MMAPGLASEQAEHALAAAIERLDENRSVAREVVLLPELVIRSTVSAPRTARGAWT